MCRMRQFDVKNAKLKTNKFTIFMLDIIMLEILNYVPHIKLIKKSSLFTLLYIFKDLKMFKFNCEMLLMLYSNYCFFAQLLDDFMTIFFIWFW